MPCHVADKVAISATRYAATPSTQAGRLLKLNKNHSFAFYSVGFNHLIFLNDCKNEFPFKAAASAECGSMLGGTSGYWSPNTDFEDVEVLWPEPKR